MVAAGWLSDVAVPSKLVAGVAQAQLRIQDVIDESRGVRRMLRRTALRKAKARTVRSARDCQRDRGSRQRGKPFG
jgi:hypothetical protein